MGGLELQRLPGGGIDAQPVDFGVAVLAFDGQRPVALLPEEQIIHCILFSIRAVCGYLHGLSCNPLRPRGDGFARGQERFVVFESLLGHNRAQRGREPRVRPTVTSGASVG